MLKFTSLEKDMAVNVHEIVPKVEAAHAYARNACVPTGEESLYRPTHLVEMRLDASRTPYVHAYNILQAVNQALLRPGQLVASVDRFGVKRPITKDLFLSAGDTPHQSRFPGLDPAVELLVTYQDGVQRKVLGFDLGQGVTQRNAPLPLGFEGAYAESEDLERFKEYVRFQDYPGLHASGWVQAAADHVGKETLARYPLNRYHPMVHSVSGFNLPHPDDSFRKGPFTFACTTLKERPLKKIPEGRLVSTRVSFIQNGTNKGGGVVNMAHLPYSSCPDLFDI